MSDGQEGAPWQRLSLLSKGLPPTLDRLEVDARDVAARGLNLLAGDVPLPVAVLKASALDPVRRCQVPMPVASLALRKAVHVGSSLALVPPL